MTRNPSKLIPQTFTGVPSLAWIDGLRVRPVDELDESAGAIVVSVQPGTTPPGVDLDADGLERAGFEAKPAQTLMLPQATGPQILLVGTGPTAELDVDGLRNLAAGAARATSRFAHVGLRVTSMGTISARDAGQALVEGFILARYRFSELQTEPKQKPLETLDVFVDGADPDELAAGISAGVATARAAAIARDLANTPPGHLTATDMGEIAVALGARFGFAVEVFDKAQLIELGCGGLLGVNAGSEEEPRMIVLRRPGAADAPTLAMIGKGIMYDSGGISLKPSDPMHLLMKMDMGGAAAILGAFTALAEFGTDASVNAWLMCTDNMPSGSAYKLGDVLTARGGTTVEVKNTDAEGRLVMMDGLVLASEEQPDAIVDIATLTGAALMALGPRTAALFGNEQAFVDQVRAAAAATDEQLWQLPLERAYRKQLDSDIADISNLGGRFAGATTAALFLDHFVAGIPWAHIDIAGTMQSDADDSWRSAGATGYGARLLVALARGFTPVA